MISDAYRDVLLEDTSELLESLLSPCLDTGAPHRPDDFERVRFNHHECRECGHNVSAQQLAAAESLLEVEAVIEADDWATLESEIDSAGVGL